MDYIKAFAIGGFFCAVGQILIDKTKLTPAKILVGYVVSGIILSALGIYEKIADFAGAGASVPLTGFGHTLATSVKESVDQHGLLGAFTGGLSGTAGGITAAIVFGTIVALIFRSHKK